MHANNWSEHATLSESLASCNARITSDFILLFIVFLWADVLCEGALINFSVPIHALLNEYY